MAKKVTVTKAQRAAAQYTLARSSKSGQSVPNAVKKIATAKAAGTSPSVAAASH